MNITNLTTTQLTQIVALKEQIESLQSQIESIAGGGGEIPSFTTAEAPAPAKRKYRMTAAHRRKLVKALARARRIRWAKIKGKAKGKRRISAAGRAAMSAAGKARWAKVRGTKATPKPARKDWRSSPAVRAKLSAAAKARWAKAKAEGKKTL